MAYFSLLLVCVPSNNGTYNENTASGLYLSHDSSSLKNIPILEALRNCMNLMNVVN